MDSTNQDIHLEPDNSEETESQLEVNNDDIHFEVSTASEPNDDIYFEVFSTEEPDDQSLALTSEDRAAINLQIEFGDQTSFEISFVPEELASVIEGEIMTSADVDNIFDITQHLTQSLIPDRHLASVVGSAGNFIQANFERQEEMTTGDFVQNWLNILTNYKDIADSESVESIKYRRDCFAYGNRNADINIDFSFNYTETLRLIDECKVQRALFYANRAIWISRDSPNDSTIPTSALSDIYCVRGKIHLTLHNLSEARADLTKSIDLNPTAGNYFWRGCLYLGTNKVQAALSDFTSSIQIKENVDSYYWRSRIYKKLKHSDQAQLDWQKVISIDNDGCLECRVNCYIAHYYLGHWSEALNLASQISSQTEDASDKLNYYKGKIHLKLGNLEEAKEYFQLSEQSTNNRFSRAARKRLQQLNSKESTSSTETGN